MFLSFPSPSLYFLRLLLLDHIAALPVSCTPEKFRKERDCLQLAEQRSWQYIILVGQSSSNILIAHMHNSIINTKSYDCIVILFFTTFQKSGVVNIPTVVMPPYGKAGSVDDLLLDDDKKDEEISPDKPSINQLNLLVKDVILRTSWWDLYSIDLAIMCANFALLPVSYHLIGSGSILLFMIGFLLLAYIHATFTMKLAHAAIHNALAGSSHFWNRLLTVFFVEIWGGFTGEGSYEAHIQLHHPYTNVIGLGDSSSWRAPFLGRVTYLFIAPLFLPLLNTMIGVSLLAGRWWSIARLLCLATAGYVMHFCLFRYVAGLSIFGSILCMFTTRSVFYIPYIHVNIFQHIGLPMYDVKKRPKRLYQLSSAALNLPRNPLLDYAFGHSIISCHVEHHLFPRLSDNMCLKIKPVVSSYLKNNGLPYNEATYMGQLSKFYKEYDELMVHAPPITELIGIQ